MAEPAMKKPEESKSSKPKTGRSPAYPAIDLKVALEKAKALYDAEGKYAVPATSAFKAWGFGEKSSGGRDVRAALKYFGLLATEGDGDTGKVKLTEDALRVLLDNREDESEKKQLIRAMALYPPIHKKLVAKFHDGIKSDPTVAHFLVFDEKYNPGAANALVKQFKATADFAGLYKPFEELDKSEENDDSEDQGDLGGIARALMEPLQKGKQVKVMAGERVAFTEEGQPGQYLKLIASGDVDDTMLEALEDFVKRQRKRLKFLDTRVGDIPPPPPNEFAPGDNVPVSGQYKQHHASPECESRPQKITLNAGDKFPRCPECGSQTHFKRD